MNAYIDMAWNITLLVGTWLGIGLLAILMWQSRGK